MSFKRQLERNQLKKQLGTNKIASEWKNRHESIGSKLKKMGVIKNENK